MRSEDECEVTLNHTLKIPEPSLYLKAASGCKEMVSIKVEGAVICGISIAVTKQRLKSDHNKQIVTIAYSGSTTNTHIINVNMGIIPAQCMNGIASE
jgi:hypothetical protein